jgi:hypothetical protein
VLFFSFFKDQYGMVRVDARCHFAKTELIVISFYVPACHVNVIVLLETFSFHVAGHDDKSHIRVSHIACMVSLCLLRPRHSKSISGAHIMTIIRLE